MFCILLSNKYKIMKKCLVITTINNLENTCIENYFNLDYDIIIVGDKKTNKMSYLNNPHIKYIDCNSDVDKYKKFENSLPFNHYCRKNLGYIYAINNGYNEIFDTDDDNYPLDNFHDFKNNKYSFVTSPKFPNIYKLYTDRHIWGRGFPLHLVNRNEEITILNDTATNIPSIGIYQSIVNGDPDVDAIFRMTSNEYTKGEIVFDKYKNFVFNKNIYVTGNTQATFWVDKTLFHLMYIPSTVSFRFCDILRTYIAQKCMWQYDKHFCYISPVVKQIRNDHDLTKDFLSEIPVYKHMFNIINEIFDSVQLNKEKHDLLIIYNELLNKNIVQPEEITRINEFLKLI